MQADERIVNYMKERNRHAKTVACVVSVQLFVLALWLCLYALVRSGLFYSLSVGIGKIIMIALSFLLAAALSVLNFLTVIRGNKVNITRPDSIAINDGREIVKEAYSTARPVLIFKITCCLVVAASSVLVDIMLHVFMEDQTVADLYGKIIVCVIAAAAFLAAYPCIDRIACYRALLGETHELYFESRQNMALKYILSFAIPLCTCLWYVLRYYSKQQKIAWIVFPVAALFTLAIAFLANYNVFSVDKHMDI
ncbi:MAG: hypothetical protein K6F87_04720 [Lachnospiraceae bacterium]|nr:hypothetical protein [Lachnospiraceae bacterium]